MYKSTSSRWCPTPEHVMILEELYRSGIRTPKAAQINDITAHLSPYGKVEAKNVFYWFQNHKARERQKLRRKVIMSMKNPNQFKNKSQQTSQLFYYFPLQLLPQGGIVNVSPQMMTLSPKADPLNQEYQCLDIDKASTKTDDHRDWIVVLDVGPTCNKPLKTLELFPTTPTAYGLKNACATPTQSSSASTNQP